MTTPIMIATGQNESSVSTNGSGTTMAAEPSMIVLRTRLTLQPASKSRVDSQPANNAPAPEPKKAMAKGIASSLVVRPNSLR